MPLRRESWRVSALAAMLLCLAAGATVADRRTDTNAKTSPEGRRLIIRSGTLFTKEGVPIRLSGFDSEIQTDNSSSPGTSGLKQIKDVLVHSGQAFVRAQDLSKLLQSHIKNDKLTDLLVETSGTEMKISGHVKKAIPVHFEIRGPVSVTRDGLIDLHESSTKIDKLPKGLFDLFGMDPSHIMSNDSHTGIVASKDDIVFDPNLLWGLSVQGKLTGLKVLNNGLMLIYGAPPKSSATLRAAR